MGKSLEKIAVIGAGLMGHAISQVFLASGHQVALHDPNKEILADAPKKIADIFTLLEQDSANLAHLSLHASLPEAVVDADLVIEAGPEKLPVKRAIFESLLASTKPTAILATNTSAIALNSIGEGLADPSRIIGTHFWNPPHLVRLVEVIQSEFSDVSAVTKTIQLLNSVGMKPVHVKRDVPGCIGNRLQHAMKREAIALVSAGVCDAETIDTVVKYGFGSRLAVLGPLEQSDLVGLNLTLDIYKTLFPTLDNTAEPPALLVDKVANGDLGMKTGKGFREWTPESAQAVRDHLRDFLVSQAKMQSKE
jgi:3-hydroxybutyryl-CoA dehydrogenase